VQVQHRKAIQDEKAVQLRYQQQIFKEREQCLKEMKYEGTILKMNIAKMCAKDRARSGLLQEEIRSRYCQASSFIDN